MSRVPESEWRWFGSAAHFICGHRCRFHLATKVGGYLVSTVGEYVPSESTQTISAESRGFALTEKGDAREEQFLKNYGFEKLGAWGTYETMVFAIGEDACDCGCGLPSPRSWGSLDSERYDSAADATNGHYKFCELAATSAIKEHE